MSQHSQRSQRRHDTRTIVVVGVVHGTSHFGQLLLAPLFPWIREAFSLSYAELGLLMTVFFFASGVFQAGAGFLVDRVGAVRVLLGALALYAVCALGFATSTGYAALLVFAAVGGLANSPFHPIDFSILNASVAPTRLGHAYAVHGVTGNLGWAVAPLFLVSIAATLGWRYALAASSLVFVAVWLLAWFHRDELSGRARADASRPAPGEGHDPRACAAARPAASVPVPGAQAASGFAFLRLPAVWMSFGFFFAAAGALSGVQSFAPEAARQLHAVPLALVAVCLSAYMVAGAGGMIVGGFLAADPRRAERLITFGFGSASVLAVLVGVMSWPGWMVPVLFALIGFGTGTAGPSRDLLVRRAAPPGATGRVYGMVYSGLDAGAAVAPAMFGALMDSGHPGAVWIGIAAFQGLIILAALRVGRVTAARAPAAAG
ncbi:MAG: MFS transporter [Burkholderiaceae bacterium]|nr:MFS transporter [Burkholderiaceae bacterium]